MTKDELKQIVDTVHANWNITPLPTQLQTIYKTWWDILHTLETRDVQHALTQLIKEDNWAPRAGTLYRRTINNIDPNPAPDPHMAWEQYRTLAKQLDQGIWEQATIHPTLQTTINTIGGYHLHTNADREHFTQIYLHHLHKEQQ